MQIHFPASLLFRYHTIMQIHFPASLLFRYHTIMQIHCPASLVFRYHTMKQIYYFDMQLFHCLAIVLLCNCTLLLDSSLAFVLLHYFIYSSK